MSQRAPSFSPYQSFLRFFAPFCGYFFFATFLEARLGRTAARLQSGPLPFPVQSRWSLSDRRSFTVLLVILRGGLFADSLHEGLGAGAFRGGGFGGRLF